MPTSSRPPRQLFWFLQTGGWLLMMVPSVGIALLVFDDAHTVFLIGVQRPLLGFVLSLALWRIYRRWPVADFKLTQHVPVILVACICAAALDMALIEGLRRFFEAPVLPDMARAGSAFIRLIVYGAWSSLYFGLRQEIESRATAARLADAIAANREAELQVLRSQLSPDFLLNGLNTIITSAKSGNSALVVDTAQSVADYLRYTLTESTRTHYAPLARELDALSGYLRAECARLGAERFNWHINATKEARQVPAPTALVQPLIENAIKHGFTTSPAPLQLSVDAFVQSGALVVIVENSGTWITRTPREIAGLGLTNLRRRLALLYDRHARIDVTTPTDTVRIEVRLPLAGV